MTRTALKPLTIAAGLMVGIAAGAEAQDPPRRLLVGATFQSYSVSADHVEGALPAVGAGASVMINPLLDLEVELLQPTGTVRREYTGITTSFAPFGSTIEEIERQGVLTRTTNERQVDAVLSIGAAFHPRQSTSRLQPRAFVGVTTHFAHERTIRAPLQWPASVPLEQVLRQLVPLQEHERALGSLTFGASVAIDLTRQLVIVPDVRYDYGSIGDEINNSWRAGTRLSWRF